MKSINIKISKSYNIKPENKAEFFVDEFKKLEHVSDKDLLDEI